MLQIIKKLLENSLEYPVWQRSWSGHFSNFKHDISLGRINIWLPYFLLYFLLFSLSPFLSLSLFLFPFLTLSLSLCVFLPSHIYVLFPPSSIFLKEIQANFNSSGDNKANLAGFAYESTEAANILETGCLYPMVYIISVCQPIF